MITANLKELELVEFVADGDAQQHCKVTFPLLGVHGTQQAAAVYFELAPGDHIGRHTDSAEEVLLILEGEAEATVGEESAKVSPGHMAVVPAMAPHDVKNIGQTTVKVLGFFGGANHITATFDNAWLPDGNNIVDTAAMTSPSAC